MKRPMSRDRRQARIAKQLSQPALLTDRIQPIRRPILKLKQSAPTMVRTLNYYNNKR